MAAPVQNILEPSGPVKVCNGIALYNPALVAEGCALLGVNERCI
jgi:hypothetical protein